MSYQVDLSIHFKIWFSCHPELFMPERNQHRLKEFRITNSSITIKLIYSSDLLTQNAHEAMQLFARQYGIELFDLPLRNPLEIDRILANLDDEDIQLYHIAQKELLNLNNGGNPAFSSDLIRFVFLKEFRNYSDLDTVVDLSCAPENMLVDVHVPFLYPQSVEGCNNDVLLLPKANTQKKREEQETFLKRIKLELIKNCNEPFTRLAEKLRECSQQASAKKDPMIAMLSILNRSQLFSSVDQTQPYYVLRKQLTDIFTSEEKYLRHFGVNVQNASEATAKFSKFLKNMKEPKLPGEYLDEQKTICEIILVICISGAMAFDDFIFKLNRDHEAVLIPFSLQDSSVLAKIFEYSFRHLKGEEVSDLSWTDRGRSQQIITRSRTNNFFNRSKNHDVGDNNSCCCRC